MSIKEIVQKMTIEEKAEFLTGATSMTTKAFEHLGISETIFADGPQGVRTDLEKNAVMFPCLSSVGATWDKELIHKLGEALANDCIELGVDMLLAPGINIKRHILCGRNFEYISEDPILAGELGAAYIQGIQEQGVGTSLKHFALNNQELYRECTNVEVDERTLREIYLKGFEIAVKKAKPTSVMCAYNKVSSVWCAENKYLLTHVLKKEWDYQGFVVSDWSAVQDTVRSIRAGLDLRMPVYPNMVSDIKEGLQAGTITEDEIDNAVENVLSFVLKERVSKKKYDRQSQHEIAGEIAAAGITLLKNKEKMLPLTAEKYQKLAVIGEFAESPLVCGMGSAEVNVKPEFIDSPVEMLRRNLPDVDIQYKDIYKKNGNQSTMIWKRRREFVEFVKDADAVLFFIGSMQSEDTEMMDRRDAKFNPNYELVMDWALKLGKKIIVVIQSGSAMIMGDWEKKANAIVQMWLGGEAAGSAIADVLAGKVNPCGKLSETFPKVMRRDLQYPGDGIKVTYREGVEVGYRYYDKHPEEICYPFGHGLSYTEFEYNNLEVEVDGEYINLSLELKNIGKCAGAEVVQIYVSDPVSTVTKPIKELKAFEKIYLKSGEERTIQVRIPVSELAYYNTLLREWIVEDGRYNILIGSSSQDIHLQGSILIEGQTPYTLNQYGESAIG